VEGFSGNVKGIMGCAGLAFFVVVLLLSCVLLSVFGFDFERMESFLPGILEYFKYCCAGPFLLVALVVALIAGSIATLTSK